MTIFRSSFLLFIILMCCFSGSAQSIAERIAAGKVFQKEERPNLSIEYSKIGRFKLAARKSVYHVGEMINLAGAIINDTKQDVFLRKLEPQFYLFSENGQELKIQDYVISDYFFLSEDFFDLTEPDSITFKPFELLAGCDDKIEEIINTEGINEDKQLFEKGLFAMYLGPCLKIKQPGIYTIKARQENQFVVDSTEKVGVKTATGVIESEPIRIKIIK